MHRYFVLILLFSPLLLLTQSCSPKLALETSYYQPQPLVIDGSGDDWTKLPRFYDAESKLSYDVSNDDQNLYVVLKAVDNNLKSKILRGGFNIWVDTTWQRKQTRGIKFPLPATERTMQFSTDDQKKDSKGAKDPAEIKEMHRKFARNITEMELVGLANGKTARTTAQNTYGVMASISLDKEGTLFYEVAIPLKQIFHDSITMPLTKRKVAIGLVSNKPEAKPEGQQSDPNRAGEDFGKKGTGSVGGGDMLQGGGMGGRGGGMGGHGGGAGGYGAHSGNASWGNDADKQINLWMTLQLVPKGN